MCVRTFYYIFNYKKLVERKLDTHNKKKGMPYFKSNV